MKENIKRLRQKKIESPASSTSGSLPSTFRIESNPDETNNELDISIHEANIPESSTVVVDGVRTLATPKKLLVRVNNNPLTTIIYGTDGQDVILKTKGKGAPQRYEAIYQFSVPFDQFLAQDNVIIVYQDTEIASNEIAYLEYFAEIEDNFLNVRLDRPGDDPTKDQSLWDAIKSRWININNNTLKFNEYREFIDTVLNGKDFRGPDGATRDNARLRSSFIKSEEYNLIKFATEFYMLAKFGMDTRQLSGYLVKGKLPYYDIVIDKIKDDESLKKILDRNTTTPTNLANEDYITYERIFNPIMIELIWSYWMEQGMLVQTLNVINLRFQNIKGNQYADRLQRFDADPLRPLSHILWGHIQDEQHRLSIQRRVYEYDHEYGLTLTGRAIPRITPVDSRVPFLEAFHNLLNQCVMYFHESDDTTRVADAFPILNSLKEVHLLLAEGNHNAYGNLTWTARHEMLMQQYILSRPEMREFLGGRTMVPYPETWMDRVDTMRTLQGWGGSGIMHYYELAVHGEQILLSIRYGNWSDVTLDRNNAANWAQSFRNPIQRYNHAYRAVTGVDLTADQIQNANNFALQPAFLIQQRLLQDNARMRRAS